MRRHPHPAGFTLIELSIVLVIIGLIVGGVLVGRELMASANVRKVIKERESYESAFVTFKLKYGGLPGDLPNPGRIWPSESWNRNTAIGNNDGMLRWDWEGPEAWRQLSLAGLVSATFLADCTADAETSTFGTFANACKSIGGKTTPTSMAYPNSTWTIYYAQARRIDGTSILGRVPGNHLSIAGKNSLGHNRTLPKSGALSSVDAYSIDIKTDDGMPLTGRTQVASAMGQKRCWDSSFAGSHLSSPYMLRKGITSSEVDGASPNVDYSNRRNCSITFKMSF